MGKRVVAFGESSAAEVARLSGFDRGAVWRWVTGRRMPSGWCLLRLRETLGISADAVLTECQEARERRARALDAERVRKAAE